MAGWFAENWFDLLSTIGIVASLAFTTHSLRAETKSRRISNLIRLTQSHREIWTELLKHPKLARVLAAQPPIAEEPITIQEEILVNLIIQQLHAAFHAMSDRLVIRQQQLGRDITDFFSLPIPHAIWEKNKVFQNDDFVAFVGKCARSVSSGK